MYYKICGYDTSDREKESEGVMEWASEWVDRASGSWVTHVTIPSPFCFSHTNYHDVGLTFVASLSKWVGFVFKLILI